MTFPTSSDPAMRSLASFNSYTQWRLRRFDRRLRRHLEKTFQQHAFYRDKDQSWTVLGLSGIFYNLLPIALRWRDTPLRTQLLAELIECGWRAELKFDGGSGDSSFGTLREASLTVELTPCEASAAPALPPVSLPLLPPPRQSWWPRLSRQKAPAALPKPKMLLLPAPSAYHYHA